MKVFYRLFSAHLKDMLRDKASIFWFLVFPLLIVFFYGLLFSNMDTGINYKVAVSSQERSPFLDALNKVPLFDIEEMEVKEAFSAVEAKKVVLAVLINSSKGQSEEVVLHYLGTSDSGMIASGIAKQVLQDLELSSRDLPRRYEVLEEVKESPSERMFDYILPGILGMALMQLGLFGSLQFVIYRERQIIKRLILAPVNKVSFLGSEIFLRLVIGLIQAVIILVLGYLMFKVPIKGNYLALLGLIVLGLGVFISLGFFISSFAKTAEGANGLIQVVQFPMMFLAGIFFPIEILPRALKPVVKILPLTYFGDSLRQVVLGIPGEFPMSTNLLILFFWFIISYILAAYTFRWE